jgi:hypothetical protein
MMTAWHWLLVALTAPATAAALYALHRLALRLEDRGWLYYRRKKPESSPAAMWVAMQQFIEPGVRHVREVRQIKAEQVQQRLLDYLCDRLPITAAAAVPAGLPRTASPGGP